MVSFGIITISHGREKILKLFLASIKRIREDLEMYVPCVCVGDAEHRELCEAYHVVHIAHENHPASRKWNKGVEYMMNIGVEYITIIGSDDLMSTDLVRNLMAEMEKGHDLIGVESVYFYAVDTAFRGQLRKLYAPKAYFGVGRTIHRRVIEKTGTLWTRERSWGMDGDCLANIAPHIKTQARVQGVVVDVKSRENLNKATFWFNKIPTQSPVNEFTDILGEEEKEILKTL